MKISIEQFGGITPGVDTRLIKENAAAVAENCFLESGKIVPVSASGSGYTGSKAWDDLAMTDRAESCVNGSEEDRIYKADGTGVKMKGGTVTEWRNVGIDAPTTALTIAVQRYYTLKSGFLGDTSRGTGSIKLTTGGVSTQMTGSITTLSGDSDGMYAAVEVTFSFPGIAQGLCDEDAVTGYSHGMWGGSGTLIIQDGSKHPFEMQNGASAQEPIVIKRKDGSEYCRLDYTGWEITDINTSFTGSPTSGQKYTKIIYPCTIHLYFNLSSASPMIYRQYIYTLFNKYGEESPPSPVTEELVKLFSGDTVKITAPTIPTGCIGAWIYRTSGDIASNTADFYLFTEYPLNASSSADIPLVRLGQTIKSVDPNVTNGVISDVKEDIELGEKLDPVTNPPTDLKMLVSSINGSYAAVTGTQEICMCEPYLPYNWKPEYRYMMKSEIVGLAITGSSVVALTKAEPEVISGTHPGAMAQGVSGLKQSCVSKNSIVTDSGNVYYASPDGLVAIDGNGNGKVITAKYFSRRNWQELDPSTMRATSHDGKIFISCEKGMIVIDPNAISGLNITTISKTDVTGICSDIESDTLYIKSTANTNTLAYNSGTARWRSRLYAFPKGVTFGVAKIHASAECTLKVFVRLASAVSPVPSDDIFVSDILTDMTLAATVQVEAVMIGKGFRLPALPRGTEWQFEISSEGDIHELTIGQNFSDIA